VPTSGAIKKVEFMAVRQAATDWAGAQK